MEIEYPIDNLLSEIIADSNLYDSFDYVINHLESKAQRDKYRPLQEKIVENLRQEISQGIFRITMADVKNIHVKDGPKERDCQAPKVVKRIGCHAIMVVFEKYVYQVVINKKYLTQEQLDEMSYEPVELKPWDPLGMLAR